MKQPALGKKIVELRKAKGYTQEELVDKCNLNVRTLQRIETGVVTPRTYTIKIIFEALDYKFYESPEDILNKFKRTDSRIIGTFRILFNHILDIINLKKHTLYKVLVLIILILSILLILPKFYTPNKDEAIAKVREQIENSNINLTKWYTANQFDSIEVQYLDSTNLIFDNVFPLIFQNELPAITNPKGVVSYYEFLKLAGIQIIEKKSRKIVVSNEIAVDIGILIFKGDLYGEKSGTYFCQWHNVNEKWQIETEMFNLK